MKLILSCTIVLILILIGTSSQAQAPLLTVYDKFESKYLNPDLWFGSVSTSTGSSHLESATQIKTEPTYGKGLDLLHRGYGGTGSDSGRQVTRNRFFFSDGTGITTIQAHVQVKKVQATGCLPANQNPTNVEARIGGFFFNTVGSPDSTNDVGAFIVLRRLSNSTDPSNVLEIVGYAIQCTNSDCSQNTDLANTADTLGTARVGQRIKLRITWDQAGNRFVFQKGKSAEVPLGYGLTDTFAPGSANGGAKRLDIQELVANCTTQPRPVGYMEVYFDNVYVNAVP